MTKPRTLGNRAARIVDEVITAQKDAMDEHMDVALHVVSNQDKQALGVLSRAARRVRASYQALVYLRAGQFDDADDAIQHMDEEDS